MIDGGLETPQPSAFMGDETALDPTLRMVVAACLRTGLHVDLGCGRGRLIELSRNAGREVLGLDLDPESVEYCRKRGLPAEVADARSALPALRDRLGSVTAVHLVEHLTPLEAEGLFASVAAALPAGGRFVIVTPNFRDWRVAREIFWLDPTHVRPYPPALLSDLGNRHGLAMRHASSHFGLSRRYRMRASNVFGRIRWGSDFGRMNNLILLEKSGT